MPLDPDQRMAAARSVFEPSPADRAQGILDDLEAKELETLRIVLGAALSVSRTVIGALPPDLRARLLREGLAAAGEQPVEQLAADCLAAEAAIERVRSVMAEHREQLTGRGRFPHRIEECACLGCQCIRALDGP